MPARLDLTPEQHLERVRRLTAARTRRYRERRQQAGSVTGSVTRDATAPSSTRARDVRSPERSSKEELLTPPTFRAVDRRKSRYAQILAMYGYDDAAN